MNALVETLKGFTINEAGYYESDSANEIDAKGEAASDPKVATRTSVDKKIQFTGHYQRRFATKIIDEGDPPNHHHYD